MSEGFYIGVDPGIGGGIAIYDPNQGMAAVPMPQTERDILEVLSIKKGATAVIERVHSMPGQGVASTFKFGQSYGALVMALTASNISFVEVTPQKWMKHYGIKRGKDETKIQFKNRLKRKAQQMYPFSDITLKTADAILICEYARSTIKRKENI